MVNCDSRPSIVKLLLNPGLAELADKLLFPVLVVRVPEKPLDIQNPGMVIEGHIEPGHVVALPLLEQLKKAVKITGSIFFKAPAPLTGHIQASSHSRIPIIQNGDAAKVDSLSVSVPAMAQLVPAAALHSQQLYPGLRVLVLAAYRQPIIENNIL